MPDIIVKVESAAQKRIKVEAGNGFIGPKGDDGLSAYQVAVENGFSGNEAAWLASLEGADGAPGSNGAAGQSAYALAVELGFVGDEAAWLASLVGDPGPQGDPGNDGADGLGVPAGGSAGQILAKVSGDDNDTAWVDPPVATGPANQIAAFDENGELFSPNGFLLSDRDGFRFAVPMLPDGESAYSELHQIQADVEPQQASPDFTAGILRLTARMDPQDSGFEIGTAGQALVMHSLNVEALGSGNLGSLTMFNTYFNVGNGTDPIDVNGFAYMFGFANFYDGVTLVGPVQGYIFQPSLSSGVVHESYTVAFGDFANIQCPADGYTSMNLSPIVEQINNNNNFTGVNISPTLNTMQGNAGFTGINITPQMDELGTNGFQGINISPQSFDAGANNVVGLNIYMGNVTGANVKALQVTGDVSINGALSFTGGLSIGRLQAFYQGNPIESLDGNPQGLHGLVSAMVALEDTTTANGDAIGVNTAMLITMQENAVVTSGPFQLGFAAMALPCVVETHSGSDIDYMSAATYAMNLVGSSTGGTIQNLNVGRAVVIPNGITQVDNVRGWFYHEPFGPAGTNRWSFYGEDAQAYLEMGLKIGGAPGSGDQLSNSDTGLEIEDKALLVARLDSTAEGALAALDGMIIYNTTTGKFRGRAAGAWVDMH